MKCVWVYVCVQWWRGLEGGGRNSWKPKKNALISTQNFQFHTAQNAVPSTRYYIVTQNDILLLPWREISWVVMQPFPSHGGKIFSSVTREGKFYVVSQHKHATLYGGEVLCGVFGST